MKKITLNSNKTLIRRSLTGLLVAAAFLPLASQAVLAHEADCPYCSMPITQDTAKQDNETVLKFGRKRIEYKCVYCAISEAKSEYPDGDVTIAAPSEKKGRPVVVKRVAGKWSATPSVAYFVTNAPLKHKMCDVQARAFHSKAAAQSYLAKNKATFGNAKVLSLSQFVALVK